MIALLPTEQTERQREILARFATDTVATLEEPCDCGMQIRHYNGGNYHKTIELRMDSGRCWMRRTTTCEYGPHAEWEEIAFGAAIDLIAEKAAAGWHCS